MINASNNKRFFIFVLCFLSSFTLSAAVIDKEYMLDFMGAICDFDVEKVKELSEAASDKNLDQSIGFGDDQMESYSWDQKSFLHFECKFYDSRSGQEVLNSFCKSALDYALHWYDYQEDENKKAKTLEIITYFLTKKVDPDRLNHHGDSLLLQILNSENIKEAEALALIKLLFEHKADLDLTIKDSDGDDALTFAFDYDYVDIVRFLRSKGAEVPESITEELGDLLVDGKGAMHKALTDKVSEEIKADFSFNDLNRYHYLGIGIVSLGIVLLIAKKISVEWNKRKQKKRKPVTLEKKEPV